MYNQALATLATTTQLANYADVLVQAGLGHGLGIAPGEVVVVRYTPESAILIPYIQSSVTKAGGHLLHDPVIPQNPEHNSTLAIATSGTKEQLLYFPIHTAETLYRQAQHYIKLKSAATTTADANLDNPRYQERLAVERAVDEVERDFKENHWQSHTLGYVPSLALAEQSGVTLEAVWSELVKACQLDSVDAVSHVRASITGAAQMEDALNALKIQSLHITGSAVDLQLSLTPEARFRCSRGANVPSFECFVTPDARATNGHIAFTYPLLYEGNSIENLKVTFVNGEVTDWSASKGSEAFASLLALPGMNRLGEFALTDKRLSQIDAVIPGAPLLLENIGGTMHVAFGQGYSKCFLDSKNTRHCNQSIEHRDVVLNGDFTVVAHTQSGQEVVIFSDGICPLI